MVEETAETKVLRGSLVDEQGRELTLSNGNVKQKDEVIQYLDKETIVNKLRQIQDPRDHMFIAFLWNTGLRVSEACGDKGIRKENIDFANQEAKVTWQKNRKYNHRIVPLSANIVSLLKLYCNSFGYRDKIFDFTRQTGYNITDKHLGVSPHVIRHSFAVNFLRQQKNAMAIVHLQRMLGHSNIQTTMKYLHAVPNDLHDAMSQVSFN